MTGVWLSMATNCSKGIFRKVEEAFPSYVKERIDCEELFLKNSHKQIKSLWVKVRDWASWLSGFC